MPRDKKPKPFDRVARQKPQSARGGFCLITDRSGLAPLQPSPLAPTAALCEVCDQFIKKIGL